MHIGFRFLLPLCAGVAGFLSTDAVTAAYPKINLAVGYQVDPKWPQRPPEFRWRYCTGVAVDRQDRVWMLNEHEPQVQVYGKEGKLIDSWRGLGFRSPHSIRIDQDENVWITDFSRHVVQKFSPKGKLVLTLGTLDQAGETPTHFNQPTDAAINPRGEVFVTDGYGNNRVVHFDSAGKFVKAWGKLGVGPGELSQPHAIVIDSHGRLYVGERNNCRIQVFDQEGRPLGEWRNLVNPWGLWITPRDEILVSGSSPKRWTERHNLGNPPTDQLVLKFNTEGRALELWTFPLAQPGKMIPGEIDWIHGIAADSTGNLYLGDVADESPEHRVQKFIRLPAER
ncbi:MAG: hypothetical protein HUU20_21760 [Pirellulales bacterium]|nr:hypothetical protein [Pirellulales bacterium]